MKLVEILARELADWPELATAARQYGRTVRFYDDGCGMGCANFSEAATDQGSAIVTRSMWEAERERIAATRMDIITESLCGQEQYRTPCTVIGEYEGRMVVVEDGANMPRFIGRERLNPHMTAAQLARDARDKDIAEMMEAAEGSATRATLELLYAAGYRRQ